MTSGAPIGRRLRAALLSACAALALPAGAVLIPLAAAAQEGTTFIQIAARSSLRAGEEEARRYSARVAGVNGFSMPGGWYVVAIGPFTEAEARERLTRLRSESRIPGDSFLADGARFGERFFPVGARPAAEAPDPAPAAPAPAVGAATEAPVIDFERAAEVLGDESPAEARASEARLDREARDQLQRALASAGFYEGGIDGAFGAGTRRAMGAWQSARGYDATGVLTSAQRAALVAEFNAVFDGLGLRVVRDGDAGIDLEMPTALVAFAGYETPFARYEPTGALPEARVVLISREGGREDLAGLYEIMQTLTVVPPDGPRRRANDSFDIEGRGARIVSRTHAEHRDGRIKGFTLVWPAGDTRFERLWERMRASFDPAPAGVLGTARATPAEEQDVDLLAGLEVRRADLSRSGFFVDLDGHVLTTAEVAEGCRTIRLDEAHDARVAWSDGRIALLEPGEALAPPAVAAFAEAPLPIGEEIAVGGYPFGGALGRASVTFGTLADIKGLGAERELDRYEVATTEAEAGGPVIGPHGEVTGLLLANTGPKVLPENAALGVDASTLRAALLDRGLNAPLAAPGARMGPEDIVDRAGALTVQVSCYR